MDLSTPFDIAAAILQISLIDLLLSGDNAVVIAMACVHLPQEARRKAVLLGTGAAIFFRVVLTFAATFALRAPFLKLFGAVLLLLIAIELLASDNTHEPVQRDPQAGVLRAIFLIVVADAVMSLDNVIAVAAAAQDNFAYLLFGLLLSIPLLVFTSLQIMRLLESHPIIVQAGAALLGWVAGKTAVTDPAIAATLATQSFGLVALAPVLGAVYVLLQGPILRDLRRKARSALPGTPAAAAAAEAMAPRAAEAKPAPLTSASIKTALAAPALDTASAVAERREQNPAAISPPAAAPADAPPPAAAAPHTAPAAAVSAGAPASNDLFLKKLRPMDIAILVGVAVPFIGFIATLVYIFAHGGKAH